eukprot:12452226-Alexandrium_andersonii.AAC.1
MADDKFFGVVPSIKLFFIQETPGAQSSDAAPPAHKAVLLPLSIMSPTQEHVFWNCSPTSSGCPAPGDVLDVQLSLDALETTASLALWMLRCHSGFRVLRLRYSFASMARLRVDHVED